MMMRTAAFLILTILIPSPSASGQGHTSSKEINRPSGPSRSAAHLTERDDPEIRRGYALLFTLASNESRVDQVFLVKDGLPSMREIIHKITGAARKLREDLDSLRAKEGMQPFGGAGLPSIEQKARESIADFKQHRILSGSPPQFEKELMLSQCEALTYGAHLLQVLAKKDKNPDRRQILLRHLTVWHQLRDQVVDLIPAIGGP